MWSHRLIHKMPIITRQEMMRILVVEHEIHSVADYSEQIVAEALEGRRVSNGITKGYDLLAPAYGRVEVKFRQLPNDGRLEERVALSDAKEGEFDHLAIVVFAADFSIKGSVLVPFHEAWSFVEASPYNRISYTQACSCQSAVDITQIVAASSER